MLTNHKFKVQKITQDDQKNKLYNNYELEVLVKC